jgi:hypothetical protein
VLLIDHSWRSKGQDPSLLRLTVPQHYSALIHFLLGYMLVATATPTQPRHLARTHTCSLLHSLKQLGHFSRNRRLRQRPTQRGAQMSKRLTAKQMKAKAAQDAYWFNKDQEVSKAVTQMTDPEYKVEFDGEEMYVMCNGVKLAMRRDDCWVSIEPGVTVRDIVENGRHGIEVRMTVH